MKEWKSGWSQVTCFQVVWPLPLLWLSGPLYFYLTENVTVGRGTYVSPDHTASLCFSLCFWPVLQAGCSGFPLCSLQSWLLLTIKILQPGVICLREGAAALGVLCCDWRNGLSASIIMHNSCWRTSHSKWHHIGNGEPASTVICTVICMIEFPILRKAGDIFI